ncbi:MAG: 2-C-methyl-D-erythritol 2,4-cyclodiphosphate synthase [Clostridia bacterium]|nr:2-C-methyl-D-erythritol 2,4-cyclodiphosphate synthase [Clostridia bacterium]
MVKGKNMDIRIGHGYDLHKLVPNRPLILGGVNIPYELGLLGHSDADVLYHAVMDAVLGALALGDIGRHFPDNDPALKDIDSAKLCTQVCGIMKSRGMKIGNIDATIIAQRPKLMPYIDTMRDNLARLFECPPERVNVKATTEEGLGVTGEGLAVSAHSVVLLTGAEHI